MTILRQTTMHAVQVRANARPLLGALRKLGSVTLIVVLALSAMSMSAHAEFADTLRSSGQGYPPASNIEWIASRIGP